MLARRFLVVLLLVLLSLPLLSCNGTNQPRPTQEAEHSTPTDPGDALTQPRRTPTLVPTLTPRPRPTPTIIPTLTVVPTPTPTSTPEPQIRLQQELPRRVWEEFFDNYYSSCSKPAFETLGVVESWSGGQGEREITFTPPSGSYFLVLLTQPEGETWRFNSSYATGNRAFDSLHVSSDVPHETSDSQLWCYSGYGVIFPDTLRIESHDLNWTVFLISPAGKEELSTTIAAPLEGYYGACPPRPGVETLVVSDRWTGGQGNRVIEYTVRPPSSFLVVEFEPDSSEWYFESIDRSGDWSVAGPRVSDGNGGAVDTTALCPSSSSPHNLAIETRGGTWTIYHIEVE